MVMFALISVHRAVNDALRAKFLDLKEGAIVVSLQTFKRGGSHVSEMMR